VSENNLKQNEVENEVQGEVQNEKVKENDDNNKKSPGIFSVIASVLAAMIGIQSDKNRERDFESGNMGSYIFVGIVMVFIFIMTLISIVDSILESAGQK
jgi:hypothetical protein